MADEAVAVTDEASRQSARAGLIDRVRRRTGRVAIIGLGHVGIPLAHQFAKGGFRTIGFDTDAGRVTDLRAGVSYLNHLEESFEFLAACPVFKATTDEGALREADFILICVPTALDGDHVPDLSRIGAAASSIVGNRRPAQLVVLESTSYPGTTRDVLVPALTGNGAAPFIAYSPERINPGAEADYVEVPKLVGGVDDESTEIAVVLYQSVFADVRPVRNVEVAEAAKLLENTFRAVNIALVNELKVSLGALGIDIWEVIEAAASKPFGYMPFYPGPGVGGHCIAVDPTYLTWKAALGGNPLVLTEAAVRVNESVRGYIVECLAAGLARRGREVAGSAVLVIGVSYKRGIGDVREAPGIWMLEVLEDLGAQADFHDPHVAVVDIATRRLVSVDWNADSLANFDAAIICTDHDLIDYSLLTKLPLLVVDTRNAMASRGFEDLEKIVKA